MTRLVIDIHEDGDLLATKETVAMLLAPIGRVRVVSVITLTTWRRPFWTH